jgi:hypothetical protein
MILQARDVGELAAAQMQRALEGRVTRVFRRSAYVETGEGLILLLQGDLKSPMTVNIGTDASLERLVSAGSSCALGEDAMKFDGFEIMKNGASVYRSALLDRRKLDILAPRELAKGIAALGLLYGVSPSSLNFVGSESLSMFVEAVVRPLGRGETQEAYRSENYLPLVGMGSGFTPAGDDFVAGFLATFNFLARSTGAMEVTLPWSDLVRRTVPESARMLDYAQRGHTDEDLSRLILSATSTDHGSFVDNLLEVARRGHTSGIDMSLGVILASVSGAGFLRRSDSTEKILDAVSRLRTL